MRGLMVVIVLVAVGAIGCEDDEVPRYTAAAPTLQSSGWGTTRDCELAEALCAVQVTPTAERLMLGSTLDVGTPTPSAADENKIILTFDDCGYAPVAVGRILDILARYNAKGIFFTTGACVELYPDVFERAVAEGHLIGNHTYNHPENLTTISLEEARWQIANGPPQARGGFWRPPLGAHNAALDQIAQELGYTLMMWTINPEDTLADSPQAIIDAVLNNARPGDVVLLHVHAAHTPEALATIVEKLQAAGYVLHW